MAPRRAQQGLGSIAVQFRAQHGTDMRVQAQRTKWQIGLQHRGVQAALAAALLFGASTPVAKWLLGEIDPWLLAGLLYLGSGLGLSAYRILRRVPRVRLPPSEWPWLAGAIASGGVIAPVLLMFGLSGMAASSASLLLNAEGVLTTLLAWFVFREHFDRRIAVGMGLIVLGAVILSWPVGGQPVGLWASLAVLGACLAWAIDNNLTRKVSLVDATWVAGVKGLAAGAVNLALAGGVGAAWPAGPHVLAALGVGSLAYGVSLALFVVGLRQLGTARTGAYFSVAPFFGAVLAIPLLGEPVTAPLLLAGVSMGVGVWLHLTERHGHEHAHDAMEHEHEHVHDEHHRHQHEAAVPSGTRHTHWHRHEPIIHSHLHFPDAHHRHDHGR